LGQVGLQVNPATDSGSCTAKAAGDAADHDHVAFTFLGFTFRARAARQQEGHIHRLPARCQQQALTAYAQQGAPLAAAPSQRLTLADLAQRIKPVVEAGCSTTGVLPALRWIPPETHQLVPGAFLRRKFRRLRPFPHGPGVLVSITRSSRRCSPLGQGAPLSGKLDDKAV